MPTSTAELTRPLPSKREFVFLLAALTGTTALGTDLILPTFDDLELAYGVSSSSVALTVTVYFLGLASLQTVYGPLADRFGRKAVLIGGLAGYALAAFASGFAPNFETLLVGRFLWGVAAGAPRAMALAIARDIHTGERLARIVSAATAAFMIVPVVAPLLGQGLLSAAGWRFTFAASALPALALLIWLRRLPETLPIEERAALSLASTRNAVGKVFRTKATLGFTLALMFDFASFGSFLSSSAQLFDTVYDRDDSFALLFAAMSVAIGVFVLAGSRLVGTMGSRRLLRLIVPVGVAASLVAFAMSWAASGSPSFWPWFLLVTAINCVRTLMNSLASAEAMGPMGAIAGTAAAVTGTVQLGGGAALATITDRFIDNSVTPLMLAYFVYGVCSWAAILFAQKHSPQKHGG